MTSAVRLSAGDADGWEPADTHDSAPHLEMTHQAWLDQATATALPSGPTERNGNDARDLSSSDARSSNALEEPVEEQDRSTPAAPTFPEEEPAASAVTAAITRLAAFVESVAAERPRSDPADAWRSSDLDVGPRRQQPPLGRDPAGAVRQLGLELARVVAIMDARFERLEQAGAKQTGALRADVEQMIADLSTWIADIELTFAAPPLYFDNPPLPVEDASDLDHDLRQGAVETNDRALHDPQAQPSISPEQATADVTPSPTKADGEPHDGVCAPAGVDRDQAMAPSAMPETTGAPAAGRNDDVRQQEEKRFWQQVREKLFQSRPDMA